MDDDVYVDCFVCGRPINLKRTSYQERFFSGARKVCHLYDCAAVPFVGQEAGRGTKEEEVSDDL